MANKEKEPGADSAEQSEKPVSTKARNREERIKALAAERRALSGGALDAEQALAVATAQVETEEAAEKPDGKAGK